MPRLTVWMVRTALLYLGVGFTFGALMLANKGVPYEPLVWRFLLPHVEFMLLGWTAQLAMGVAVWILPRLTHAPKFGNVRLAWIAYVLFNAGLLAMTAGYLLTTPLPALTLAGRVLQLAGAGCFAVYVWPRVRPLIVGGESSTDRD